MVANETRKSVNSLRSMQGTASTSALRTKRVNKHPYLSADGTRVVSSCNALLCCVKICLAVLCCALLHCIRLGCAELWCGVVC